MGNFTEATPCGILFGCTILMIAKSHLRRCEDLAMGWSVSRGYVPVQLPDAPIVPWSLSPIWKLDESLAFRRQSCTTCQLVRLYPCSRLTTNPTPSLRDPVVQFPYRNNDLHRRLHSVPVDLGPVSSAECGHSAGQHCEKEPEYFARIGPHGLDPQNPRGFIRSQKGSHG